MSALVWPGRWWPWIVAAGATVVAVLGAAGIIALATVVDPSSPSVVRRVGAIPSPSPPLAPSPGGREYDAGVRDLCALIDLAPFIERGFVRRDGIPFASSADSSCRIVLRLADAPPLPPGEGIDTSRELIAVTVEARSFGDDPDQAAWTWRTRREYLTRRETHLHVQDVAGIGSQAFSTREANPETRPGRGGWSYGLHLWDGNLFLYAKVASIGAGRKFTPNDTESSATRLTLELLAALRV